MALEPKEPPGRSTRKARAFAAEIKRLAAFGYSRDAIRQALADAGVQVSRSTVQREVVRSNRAPAAHVEAIDVASPWRPAAEPEPVPDHEPVASNTPRESRGKDIAEAFVRGRNTNPLFRKGP